MKHLTYAPLLAASIALCATGCFDNESTPLPDAATVDGSTSPFPPHLEPWEDPNEADPPAATPTEMYPEELSFLRTRWTGGASAETREPSLSGPSESPRRGCPARRSPRLPQRR